MANGWWWAGVECGARARPCMPLCFIYALPVGWAVVASVKCIRRVNLYCSCLPFFPISFSYFFFLHQIGAFFAAVGIVAAAFKVNPVFCCNSMVAQFFIRLFSFCSWLTINWMMATKMKRMTENVICHIGVDVTWHDSQCTGKKHAWLWLFLLLLLFLFSFILWLKSNSMRQCILYQHLACNSRCRDELEHVVEKRSIDFISSIQMECVDHNDDCCKM